MTPFIGVVTLLLTSRGPPCTYCLGVGLLLGGKDIVVIETIVSKLGSNHSYT